MITIYNRPQKADDSFSQLPDPQPNIMSEGRADLVGKKFNFPRELADDPDDRFFQSATNQKPADLRLPLGPDGDAPDPRANFRKKSRPETASPSPSLGPVPASTFVHQSDSNLLLKLYPARGATDRSPLQSHPAGKLRDFHEHTTTDNVAPSYKLEDKPPASRE